MLIPTIKRLFCNVCVIFSGGKDTPPESDVEQLINEGTSGRTGFWLLWLCCQPEMETQEMIITGLGTAIQSSYIATTIVSQKLETKENIYLSYQGTFTINTVGLGFCSWSHRIITLCWFEVKAECKQMFWQRGTVSEGWSWPYIEPKTSCQQTRVILDGKSQDFYDSRGVVTFAFIHDEYVQSIAKCPSPVDLEAWPLMLAPGPSVREPKVAKTKRSPGWCELELTNGWKTIKLRWFSNVP